MAEARRGIGETCDIAIVGAGAAGLAAAIFASDDPAQPRRIVVLDGAVRVGAKILVSGGGRCNVTHHEVAPDDFAGPRNVIRNVLAAFTQAQTVAWMQTMGVRLKREPTGKLFPVTDSAHTVLDALLEQCRRQQVEIRTGCRVQEVAQTPGGFVVRHEQGELAARRLVLATGGRSLPRTGSDGSGWSIARTLGHSVTQTCPALVPLVLAEGFFHASLAGLSMDVTLSTFADGRRIDQRQGSLLWTHFGISGPVVMDASRYWVIAHSGGQRAELRVSFVPGQGFEQAERRLVAQASQSPRRSLIRTLSPPFADRFVEALVRHAGLDPAQPLGQLPRENRRRLVHALTDMVLPVVRDRGWNYAEVTAGGVPLGEIDYRTMESRLVPGLYLVGEILDCDGRIGGFNFQWAWSTGHVAGRAVAAMHARPSRSWR